MSILTGLVYLRFSGMIHYEHGKLIWKSSDKGLLVHLTAPDTTTASFNVTRDCSSNGTRQPNTAESNAVGTHLKSIAKRLMLYPLGELHAYVRLGVATDCA
jgi:hypothetical protein